MGHENSRRKSEAGGSKWRRGGDDSESRRRGRNSSGSFLSNSGGGRGVQASADALRRRQKAKKAATVKRHSLYKTKNKLIRELESEQGDQKVLVAPGLPCHTPLEDTNGFPADSPSEGQMAVGRETFSREQDSDEDDGDGSNCCEDNRGSDVDEQRRCAGPQSIGEPMVQPAKETAPRVQTGRNSPESIPERKPRSVAFVEQKDFRHQRKKSAAIPSKNETTITRGSIEKKRFKPYQKELAIAAARRAEQVRTQPSFFLWVLCFPVYRW